MAVKILVCLMLFTGIFEFSLHVISCKVIYRNHLKKSVNVNEKTQDGVS